MSWDMRLPVIDGRFEDAAGVVRCRHLTVGEREPNRATRRRLGDAALDRVEYC